MLYEPGPIRLIPDAEWPTLGPRSDFVALAAAEAGALEGAALALGGAQLAIAASGAGGLDPGAVFDLAAAAGEHDRQSHDSDLSLGGVAASAEALEGELAGLSIETASDLSAGVPTPPAIPPGAEPPREPGGIEIPPDQPAHVPPNPPAFDWPTEPPVPRDGSGGSGSALVVVYRKYMVGDIPRVLGRQATADDFELVNLYESRYGYIDNAAYSWIFRQFYGQ